jgi:pimeloyl-ACP methyl ester carboxylesterase
MPRLAHGIGSCISAGLLVAVTGCSSSPSGSSRAPSAYAVASAPVQLAHTPDGDVGYRSIGSGSPLVLIMGYAGTMEVWDPLFVQLLSRDHRVIVFDNAGIGQTSSLPAPLTVDAMADQTSALIDTLGLGAPDVFGWSMGGMIAQALAVRHPAQVRRLVLAATFPGNGETIVPAQSDIDALTNGAGNKELFPADQQVAAQAFDNDIATYPSSAAVSSSVMKAQANASLAWFHGTDAAGKRTSNISVPALVADGEDDRLDNIANDQMLGTLIPGSTLVAYPDAGHAFFVQDSLVFVHVLQAFLAGPSAPLGVSAMQQEFVAGFDSTFTAGEEWASETRASPSATQLRADDATYGLALSTYGEQLLSFGAPGAIGNAVTSVVDAHQKLLDDVLALGGQQPHELSALKSALSKDAATVQTTDNVLRNVLSLPASALPSAVAS